MKKRGSTGVLTSTAVSKGSEKVLHFLAPLPSGGQYRGHKTNRSRGIRTDDVTDRLTGT